MQVARCACQTGGWALPGHRAHLARNVPLSQGPPRRRAATARAASSSGSSSSGEEPPAGTEGGAAPSFPDALPLAGADTDWRAFRARLVAATAQGGGRPSAPSGSGAALLSGLSLGEEGEEEPWAHKLPRPEPGCLLLAHPLIFSGSQTYFHQAAILLFQHDERGSAGLILNRPTEHKVGAVAGAGYLQPEFSQCTLHLGGDVGNDTVHLLHGLRGLEGSVEVVQGVQLGGFPAAKAGLASGRFQPQQFKVLTRYAGWGPGQLEEECKRGVWFPAAASHHLVLQPVAAGANAELWHVCMQLMGGDYAALSGAMKQTYDSSIMELVDREQERGMRERRQQQQEEAEAEEESEQGSEGSEKGGGSTRQQRSGDHSDCRDGGGI